VLGFREANGDASWQLPEDRPATLPRRPIVVSHGTAIRITATALMELPLNAARHVAQDNASLNIFVWRIDRWVLKLWNDTTHHTEP
jgi:broad specificity phosphatase PhoE